MDLSNLTRSELYQLQKQIEKELGVHLYNPDDSARAILKEYLNGLTQKQLSEIANVSISTVQARMRDFALRFLRANQDVGLEFINVIKSGKFGDNDELKQRVVNYLYRVMN